MSKGGAAADALLIQELVSGKVDRPLVLTGVSAANVQCSRPLVGTEFVPTGAGPLPNRVSSINLDSTKREAAPERNLDGSTWTFPLQVSNADAERFTFIVATADGDCRFKLAVHYRDGDSARTQTFDDHGRPFRVTASSSATSQVQWMISGNSVTVAP